MILCFKRGNLFMSCSFIVEMINVYWIVNFIFNTYTYIHSKNCVFVCLIIRKLLTFLLSRCNSSLWERGLQALEACRKRLNLLNDVNIHILIPSHIFAPLVTYYYKADLFFVQRIRLWFDALAFLLSVDVNVK